MSKWTPERVNCLKRMVALGYEGRAIAKLMGVTLSSMRNACTRYGVKYPARKEREEDESPYFNPREVDCWLLKSRTKWMTTANHARYLKGA